MSGIESHRLIVGHRVVDLELETDGRPLSLRLEIRVDGAKRWSSEEPGWRDIACGVVDNGVFVWSARHLVLVSFGDVAPQTIEIDEDLLTVFQVASGWLLVCETSVRLVCGDTESSRLELPDVIRDATWSGDRLVIRCEDDSRVGIRLRDVHLEIDSDQ